MPCAVCGTRLPQHNFTPTEVSNHFTRAIPVVCVDCKKRGCSARGPERYACDGPCNQLLGRKAYASQDWARMKQETKKRLVCEDCKKVEVKREQHLRELMRTSKRKKCTCHLPLGHAEKCPMHISYSGERPYPGCDVMSRSDSDWLQQRTQRPRHSSV